MYVAGNRWVTKLVGKNFILEYVFFSHVVVVIMSSWEDKQMGALNKFTIGNYSRQPCVFSAFVSFFCKCCRNKKTFF